MYLDLNGHFHYWAYQAAKNEAHLIKLVFKDVDRILKLLQPKKSVVVAMDGPAPRAKLLTQRARRARKDAAKEGPAVDTSMLTPGTPMMARVRHSVVYLICSRLQSQKYANITFFWTGPEVAGEGETKVQERLLANTTANPNDSHCCFGSDADLIVQCIASASSNVSVCMNFQKQDHLLDIKQLVLHSVD